MLPQGKKYSGHASPSSPLIQWARYFRRIDFNNASEEDLAHLARAGEPATFGVNQENILDEQYRKSKKIDTAHFSPLFDVNAGNVVHLLRDEFIPEGMQDVDIRIERYKLNVYGMRSCFLVSRLTTD